MDILFEEEVFPGSRGICFTFHAGKTDYYLALVNKEIRFLSNKPDNIRFTLDESSPSSPDACFDTIYAPSSLRGNKYVILKVAALLQGRLSSALKYNPAARRNYS